MFQSLPFNFLNNPARKDSRCRLFLIFSYHLKTDSYIVLIDIIINSYYIYYLSYRYLASWEFYFIPFSRDNVINKGYGNRVRGNGKAQAQVAGSRLFRFALCIALLVIITSRIGYRLIFCENYSKLLYPHAYIITVTSRQFRDLWLLFIFFSVEFHVGTINFYLHACILPHEQLCILQGQLFKLNWFC